MASNGIPSPSGITLCENRQTGFEPSSPLPPPPPPSPAPPPPVPLPTPACLASSGNCSVDELDYQYSDTDPKPQRVLCLNDAYQSRMTDQGKEYLNSKYLNSKYPNSKYLNSLVLYLVSFTPRENTGFHYPSTSTIQIFQ